MLSGNVRSVAKMSVIIRQAGNEWLIEVQGEAVGTASTEAEAQVLAAKWTAKLKWVASWRFGQQPQYV